MTLLEHRAFPYEFLPRTRERLEVGRTSEVTPGTVVGVGPYAVGNAAGEYFALTRSCRHLAGDLAEGRIDKAGCLVCPLHGSRYDVKTGKMVSGPRGIYERIPGLEAFLKAFCELKPLGRGQVTEEDGVLYVE